MEIPQCNKQTLSLGSVSWGPADDSVGVETCNPIPMLIGNKIFLCLDWYISILYIVNLVSSAFIQLAFNERNTVRLLCDPYCISYNSFFRNIKQRQVQAKNACINCLKLHVLILIICLCVFLCVDSWTVGQWSRCCRQKEKASPATSKSVHRRTGLWAACRKYIWCWRGLERAGSDWFLSCIPLLAYLQSAGIEGDIWDVLQEAEEKTGPSRSAAAHKHGNSMRIWTVNCILFLHQVFKIYLLTAIGLTSSGSSTVHIYTQTIHRITQLIWEECGLCPIFASYTLAFALQLRKKYRKTSVGVVAWLYSNLTVSLVLLVAYSVVCFQALFLIPYD